MPVIIQIWQRPYFSVYSEELCYGFTALKSTFIGNRIALLPFRYCCYLFGLQILTFT